MLVAELSKYLDLSVVQTGYLGKSTCHDQIKFLEELKDFHLSHQKFD